MIEKLDDEGWEKEILAKMGKSGEQHWLVGLAHCTGCAYKAILVCPLPIGLEPDAECFKCHKMLMVFDRAEEYKVTHADQILEALRNQAS